MQVANKSNQTNTPKHFTAKTHHPPKVSIVAIARLAQVVH